MYNIMYKLTKVTPINKKNDVQYNVQVNKTSTNFDQMCLILGITRLINQWIVALVVILVYHM